MCAPRKKRRKIGREHDSTITKAISGALARPIVELAEVAPVHLGLLAGQRPQPQVGLGRRPGTLACATRWRKWSGPPG